MEMNHVNILHISFPSALFVFSSFSIPSSFPLSKTKRENLLFSAAEIWQLGLICRETTEILHQHAYKWRERGKEGGSPGGIREEEEEEIFLCCKNACRAKHQALKHNNSMFNHSLMKTSTRRRRGEAETRLKQRNTEIQRNCRRLVRIN